MRHRNMLRRRTSSCAHRSCQQEVEAAHPAPARGRGKRNAGGSGMPAGSGSCPSSASSGAVEAKCQQAAEAVQAGKMVLKTEAGAGKLSDCDSDGIPSSAVPSDHSSAVPSDDDTPASSAVPSDHDSDVSQLPASPDGTWYLAMPPTPTLEWSEPESLQRFLSQPPSPPRSESSTLRVPVPGHAANATQIGEFPLTPASPPAAARRVEEDTVTAACHSSTATAAWHSSLRVFFSEGGDAGGGSQSSNRATHTPHSSHRQLHHRHRRHYRSRPGCYRARDRANPQIRAGPPAIGGEGSEGKGNPDKGQSKEAETPKERKRVRWSPPRQCPRGFRALGNPWHRAWSALFGGRIESWQPFPGPAPSPGHPFWSHKGWPRCSCGQ